MRKLLKAIMVFITLVAVVLLVLSAISRYVSPADNQWLPIIGLGYPLTLASCLLLLFFWILKRSKWSFLIIGSLLLTWPQQSDFFQLNLNEQDSGDYSLTSFNARLFGYYQFKRSAEIRDQTIDMLADIDADILCFQEFYFTPNPKGFQTKSELQKRLGPFFEHEKYTHEFVHKQNFGVVTLSKFPILYRGYIPFDGEINNFCIYSDILLPNNDTIRVFNTHLASIHFDTNEYQVVEGEVQETEKLTKGAERIISKLQSAYVKRAAQIERIMEDVNQSPYPVIFAGDFNDPPFSYTYKTVRKALEDCFKDAGSGFGNTYNGPFPSFRIDHIFRSQEIEVSSYDIVREDLSDHYPVTIEFTIDDE